ncbi:MAG: cupin domain-containing protein [Chloroflexi bacterium]|nr:cupin domain-containing protein [Chloroflexota bacterium]
MVDKTRTKAREPGASQSMYDLDVKTRREFIERQETGKLLIKANEREFRITRQGKSKYIMYPNVWPENALQDWSVFMQDLVVHTGKHRHQGGLIIFVLEGRGYTVVEGVRMDWKKGDLILLPFKEGGVEHQHFNVEPGTSCKWIAMIHIPMSDQVSNFFEQIELNPMFSGTDK